MSSTKVHLPEGYKILACKVFAPELELLGIPQDRICFLDPGLHRYPDSLKKEVAAALAGLESDEDLHTVILAYGYCGGGLEGLSSQRLRLVLPLQHDCIPLLLGGQPGKRSREEGETFYLSAGWIDHGLTPFSEHQTNVEKFGEEDALWVGRQMLTGYGSITLITSELTSHPRFQQHSQESADLFDLDYEEVPGSLSWLRRLLSGQESRDVVVIQPGEKITLAMFTKGEASVRLSS